ncbi:Serine/threonine-protein kinase N2 [Echinococcus granulosus]|uniref:Serine:threonine protein kinase N2 n=1 Tax=Echinococcus granulosus TaxID=6210 RepID=A0A068WV76_ECHGR|nr:Serine/threonine-protein kinase N2 [Echinococcus granulosus]CDS21604.1 serine:threonine protein kinase N2 [Echinococcus granulosus]
MGKAKGLTKAKRSRDSPRKSASELNLVTTTFIEVGPNTPVCIAHRRCGPCIVGGNCLKSMHLLCSGGMHLTGSSAGELFIMSPLSSAQSLNYITCDHYHKKPQQQQLYQIPAKLVPLNEIGQSSGAVECSERHMRRVGRISPDRYFGNQTQMIRCPLCEAHSRKTLDNSTTTTTTASTSSISDTEEITFTRPPRQARARYYSSPRRTSPGRFIARKSETEMVSHQRGSNRPPHQSGGNWNHEPVKLVYENRPRESTRRSPSPPHRPRSALQQMRRLDSDTHTSRMNGASRIIYASKPDTPTYHNIPIRHASPPKGTTIGFRHDITASSSSASISTSITSLPQGSPVRPPDIELDVVPPPSPRPFDNRAPHGNLIKFETTRPADVPYFDSASESNFDLNRPENHARGAGYMVARPQGNAYPGERMPPQPRIGYQEEELIPRRRTTKDPDLNMSFNFQCGADPHVPSLTPETSLGTQGPAPNMKIQARGKTGDISTTTMPTDTPTGGNALDATLETVGSLQLPPAARNSSPRILPTLVSPVSNEESSVATSQNGNTRKQDLGDGRESGFSSHAYEVVQEPPMGVTQGQDFGTHVEELATSVGVEGDILIPSQQSLGAPEEELPSPPPTTPPLPRSIDKVDLNSRNKAPLPSQDDNIDPQLDLSKKVSVQVGSLIQQRLKELTVCLGKDSQPVSRDTATAMAGDARKFASLQPRTGPRAISTQEQPPPTFQQSSAPMKELPRTSIKRSENMDSFIDQQFGGLGRNQQIPRTSSEESADRQPPPVGWKDVVESPYQNLSADGYTKTPVGGRPELQGPPQADLETPFPGSGRSGLPQPLQRGEFISQRVKELMAASGGDSHSVTSSGTATSLTAPEPVQFKLQIEDFRLVAVLGRGNFGKVLLAEYKLNNGYFALKTFRKVDMLRENCVDCMKIEKRVLQIVSEARHPCFVHMIACFQPQDYAVIVLDYLPGGDLMQHIQSGAFDEERTVFYAACVVLALEFLHLNDIMYRDLKLENLLLTGCGYLKLVDFGLCKENMGPNDKTNTFCGTPEFVAPEMITDTGYTRAVDWWCLGVLIYEMIVGKCPFRGPQEDDIYNSIVRHEPKIPLHVGPRAASIISQFMTKDPSRRLGVSAAGISDIKRHPFFSGLDFDALLANRVKPPFIPRLVGIEDVFNFDRHCTSELPRLTPAERSISPRDNRRYFADFDYTNDGSTIRSNYNKPQPC